MWRNRDVPAKDCTVLKSPECHVLSQKCIRVAGRMDLNFLRKSEENSAERLPGLPSLRLPDIHSIPLPIKMLI